MLLCQILCTDLNTEPSGHLAHGSQERQRTRSIPHRLVGDSRDLLLKQSGRQVLEGSQMEVREQQQAFAEVSVLLFDRLFYLDHHIRKTPYIMRGANDFGASILILIIRHSRKYAGIMLYQNLMPGLYQGPRSRRVTPTRLS